MVLEKPRCLKHNLASQGHEGEFDHGKFIMACTQRRPWAHTATCGYLYSSLKSMIVSMNDE